MNYENLKATIAANIYTNGNQEVTAEMVKTAINSVVDTLIAGGYLYKGVAHPGDAAETPDANVFYLATEVGTYTNKGGLQVADGEVAVLKYNGSWSKEVTGAATAAQVAALGQEVDSRTMYDLDYTSQVIVGSYIDTGTPSIGSSVDVANPVFVGNTAHIVLPCIAGDVFKLYGRSGSAPRLYAFTDENYLLISRSATNYEPSTFIEITAPANGYLIVNFILGAAYEIWKEYGESIKDKLANECTTRQQVDVSEGAFEATGNVIELQDSERTIFGVSVKSLSYGWMQITGTASSNGGRLIKMCAPFTLPAGSYRLVFSSTPVLEIFVENVSGDTIIAQKSSPTFSLDVDTSVYIGANFVSGRTYNDDFGIAIFANQSKTKYAPKLTAKDIVAREDIEALLIKLVGIAASGATSNVTGVGDVYFNTTTKLLRKCTSWSGDPTTSLYETVPFIEGAIYNYEDHLYVWDGSDLVSKELSLSEDVQDIKALAIETITYNKQQVLTSFDYITGQLWDAVNSLGKNISEVTKTVSTGAYMFKIPLNGKTVITYPVFKTTEGFGCLVTDKYGVVIAQYANSTLPTGTEETIITAKDAAYFYFSSSNSLSSLSDYSLELTSLISQCNEIGERKAIVNWLPFLSSLTADSNDSLCLAAIKTSIEDNKIPFHSGFLFHKLPNDDGKVYFGTKLDNAEEVGTLDYTPKNYVLAVSPKDGTIIGVARDARYNIRVYQNGQNYSVAAKSSDGQNSSPKGWLYNSGCDFVKSGNDEYCIFAEYDGNISDGQRLYIWKGTYPYTSPSDWKTVYYKTTSYNSGNPTPGSITHWHMIRRDPWTGILYCTSGDFSGQFFWLYSTDNGETWNELASDSNTATKPSWALNGQPLRCINFIFTEDYIYFATDHGSNNTLSRIQRNAETGVIDTATREVLSALPYGIAVNTLCYVESPNGLFMFTRIDTGFTSEYSNPVKVLFWSFEDEQLHIIASLKQLVHNWGGHRGKCYMNYTNGEECRPAMGFAGNTPCQFDLIGANGNNIGTIYYDL